VRSAVGLALVGVVACGTDFAWTPAARPLPVRARLLTDAQYTNAIHDLLGADVVVPAFQTPGSTPDALVVDDVLAIDPIVLVQYRMVAQQVGHAIAGDPSRLGCTPGDGACARARVEDLAARAFRRPLDAGEGDALWAMFGQGRADGGTDAAGFGLVVEAVLQAPGFIYRSELGGARGAQGVVELTSHELASELSFLFFDSIPDDALRATADNGSLVYATVLEHEVDRLLASDRVRARLDRLVLDWLEVPNLYRVSKDPTVFPDDSLDLRDSMFAETAAFVHDVLWKRGGKLRELLISTSSFADARLAAHYGIRGVKSSSPVSIHHDPKQRAGVLTHASMLATLATPEHESIIRRGIFVHRHFLCTPDFGRPPFSAIADVASFTDKLSESQFSYYRQANTYCSTCHRTVDPPGRMFEQFDGLGRWRTTDEIGAPVEAWARITIDGTVRDLDGAVALSRALADSDQVAQCVVDQLSRAAFGRDLDGADRAVLYGQFDDADRDLVALFRAIALSPAFRVRQGASP
jgi:hypothetical protein